jgi:hypothetical protein
VAQVVETLSSKCKAFSSNPVLQKRREKTQPPNTHPLSPGPANLVFKEIIKINLAISLLKLSKPFKLLKCMLIIRTKEHSSL